MSWNLSLFALTAVLLSNVNAQEPYHVRPGEDIQEALEAAAKDSQRKRIVVHAGTYRLASLGRR